MVKGVRHSAAPQGSMILHPYAPPPLPLHFAQGERGGLDSGRPSGTNGCGSRLPCRAVVSARRNGELPVRGAFRFLLRLASGANFPWLPSEGWPGGPPFNLLIEGGFEVRVPHSCEVCKGGAFDFNSGTKNQPGRLDAVDLLLSTVSIRHSRPPCNGR
jgi:hypothetical protein